MVREIEFEFREDQGGGSFLASGNVLATLRDYLNRGQVQEAAKLFASCTENIGAELLSEFQAAASNQAILTLAEMFHLARDYGRAAACAERAGALDKAATYFEAAYDFARAAELHQRAGNLVKAAELYERGLEHGKAANIYVQTKDFARAAESFERAGQHLSAGKLFIKLSRWDRASLSLQQVDASAPDATTAAWLLGNIYEKSNKPDAAARQYLAVVKALPASKETAEVYYRLGLLLEQLGKIANAIKVLQRLASFDTTYRDIQQRLAALALPTVEVVEVVTPEPPATERLITVDPDFEFLKSLPLFSEMSLDELKSIYAHVERVRLEPGERLIREGARGEALYIVIRGRVEISRRNDAGQDVILGELGPGAQLGEMALLDDAPTSADVRALEALTTFALKREKLREILATNERLALRFYRAFVTDLTQRLRATNKKLQGG